MAIEFVSDDILIDSGAYAASSPALAGRSDGSWFIAWRSLTEPLDENGDSRFTYDIFGRTFSGADGSSPEVIVNVERRDGQFDPDAVARPDGTFVVAYSSGEENFLPGTYAASRIIAADGTPVGAEVFGRDTYYNRSPDVALFADGGYIVVATGEEEPLAQIHRADGSIVSEFSFGYSSGSAPVVSTLAGDRALLLWQGFADRQAASGFDDEGNAVDSIRGIYGQVRNGDGSLGDPFLIAANDQETSSLSAQTLQDGRVALAYTGGGTVYLTLVDAAGAATAPTGVSAADAGSQGAPDLAVLETGDLVVVWQGLDGFGSGVLGRVFGADGSPDGDAFVIAQDVAGDQVQPSVTSIGGGRFVVGWQDGDRIEARVFADMEVQLRGEVTSTAASETLAGTSAADVFFFDTAAGASLGNDRITGFGSEDRLVTTTRIVDSNRDGIIDFGSDRLLDTGQGLVAVTGPNGRTIAALEFDGSVERDGVTYFVYSALGSAAGTGDLFTA